MSILKVKRQMMNIDDYIFLESKHVKKFIILTEHFTIVWIYYFIKNIRKDDYTKYLGIFLDKKLI